MSAVKGRRAYHSPERAERALATRARILGAAARLFEARGYTAVTVQDVAREARVAVATLYLHFPGRAALVEGLADAIAAAPDLSVERVEREPDTGERLRIGARILRDLNERSWLVIDILRGLRGADEDMARLWARWQGRHLAAVRRAADALADAGALREGVDAEHAADVLYALGGTEVYRALVRERGWTPERYERWLLEAIRRDLLA